MYANNAGCINKVDQRRARLVLRLVTVCRQVKHLGMQPAAPAQLSLAIPP